MLCPPLPLRKRIFRPQGLYGHREKKGNNLPPMKIVAGLIVGPNYQGDDAFQLGKKAVVGTAVLLSDEISIKETYS